MKRTIGVFSLATFLFSTFAPSFTYANEGGSLLLETSNLLSGILNETMNNSGNYNGSNKSETPSSNNSFDELNNSNETYFETYGDYNLEYTTILTGDNDEMNNFKYRIIKIGPYEIMDRNLGATTTGYKNAQESTYGYYYQWGNNFGFSKTPTNTTGEKISIESDYIPSNYSSPIWNTLEERTDEYARGNENPTQEERKGPCPSGWHIGNGKEYDKITRFYLEMFPENDWTGMFDYLYIPYAGYKDNNFNSNQTDRARWWTTNRCNRESGCIMSFYMRNGNFWPQYSNPYSKMKIGYGLPIRCIKNKMFRVSLITYGPTIKYNNEEVTYIDREYGDSLNLINNIEVTNRGGWIQGRYYDESFTNQAYYRDEVTGDITLYAKWNCYEGYGGKTCKKINLYLNPNGGYGEEILSNSFNLTHIFTGDGYKMIGYNTKADGSGTGYALYSKISPEDDITLYAQWGKNPWYSFDANGGIFKNNQSKSIIKYNTNIVNEVINIIEEPGADTKKYQYQPIKGSKELYFNINGFNWQSYFSINVYTGYEEINPIYSIGTSQSYPVNFVIPGDIVVFEISRTGPPTNINIDVTGFSKYTPNENINQEVIKTGYTFSGWYETGEVGPFDFNNTPITQDRTLYAKWNPHHYTIKFNTNGGTGNIEDKNATYGEEINLPNITREGYTFRGWKSENGVLYNNIIPEGTGVTSEDGATVTLTAQWDTIPPSAGGGSSINPAKQETKVTEQEHNSADTEKTTEQENTEATTTQTASTPTIEEKVKKIEGKTLTRGEVAVMTNVLLDVYPQLTENKSLNEVSKACENYADEQNFTKDEKKAIIRLCKLSIMGIHKDTKEPLDEFLTKQNATNGEFATVMDRVVANYNEKDLSVVKDALKKLENNEEGVVFGTVYDVFMSIKNIFD